MLSIPEDTSDYELKAEAEPIGIEESNIYNNWTDEQNNENLIYSLENSEFVYNSKQAFEQEEFNEIQLFNSSIFTDVHNHTDENYISNSKKEMNDYNTALNHDINVNDQTPKYTFNQNQINFKNEMNLSNTYLIPPIKNEYYHDYLMNNQTLNYQNYQNDFLSTQDTSNNKSMEIFPNLISKKIRRKRGTGDEALKKHPNDDFNYINKPCYNFLLTISNEYFRKKCTFDIICKVASIIEDLNPSIQKRTRMERRRKSVQLFWFHSNWPKIAKMKNKILEQLNSL